VRGHHGDQEFAHRLPVHESDRTTVVLLGRTTDSTGGPVPSIISSAPSSSQSRTSSFSSAPFVGVAYSSRSSSSPITNDEKVSCLHHCLGNFAQQLPRIDRDGFLYNTKPGSTGTSSRTTDNRETFCDPNVFKFCFGPSRPIVAIPSLDERALQR